MRLDLRVRLKTVDLVRETAWLALTESLGWQDCLADLKRSVLWRFEGRAASRERFISGLDEELERTSTFYNPNKEARVFLDEDSLGDGQALLAEEARGARGAGSERLWRADLWITDEGGARPDILRRTAPRLDPAGISLQSLHMGNLWEVHLHAADVAEARALLAGLALSRSRQEGLLANPHYQEAQLLALEEASS